MKKNLLDNISFLSTPAHLSFLRRINRGVERECLRITPEGNIALTPHPLGLGDSLTHPFITTDFSESLVEFITPTFNSPSEVISFLNDLHVYTISNLNDEMLWPLSMPYLRENQLIPIANYGDSNLAKFKKLYRIGLHHRYGSKMQIIAGLHYNFSMPDDFWISYQRHFSCNKSLMDFKSERYLNLIRNVHKYGWLLLYLFGASPSVCSHFIDPSTQISDLQNSKNNQDLFYPHATSLRMSHLGYHNRASEELSICHRNLESYIEDLLTAVNTKDPEFSKIGIFKNGQRIQVSENLLQIENEYYSSIRPKHKTLPGERSIAALKKRGIEYVELRNVDINPFSPVGIDESQIKFLDVFLTWCLLSHADTCNHETETHQKHNHREVVLNGRNPEVHLLQDGKKISLKQYAQNIFDELLLIGDLFDQSTSDGYQNTIKKFKTFIENPGETFSACLLKEILNKSLLDVGKKKGLEYKNFFMKQKLSQERKTFFDHARMESIRLKQAMGTQNAITFEDYLQNYMKQTI